MRAKNGFQQAQMRLRSVACHYRIKAASRSPYVQVYEAAAPRRQQAAGRCRVDDDKACCALAELLILAHQDLRAGGKGLDWRCLDEEAVALLPASGPTQTWGEIQG